MTMQGLMHRCRVPGDSPQVVHDGRHFLDFNPTTFPKTPEPWARHRGGTSQQAQRGQVAGPRHDGGQRERDDAHARLQRHTVQAAPGPGRAWWVWAIPQGQRQYPRTTAMRLPLQSAPGVALLDDGHVAFQVCKPASVCITQKRKAGKL